MIPHTRKREAVSATILLALGYFLLCNLDVRPFSILNKEETSLNNGSHLLRRALSGGSPQLDLKHIRPLSKAPEPDRETVMFWHIPKSGGTTLKSIYKCMHKALTVRIGADPTQGHDKDTELAVFEYGRSGAYFVNVDTISRPGIVRAKRMGLVPSGIADLIVAINLNFAVDQLFDDNHKGRVIALFRHPIERLISKFYYSQVATWERSYQPWLKDTTLETWAETISVETDQNSLVKTLVGKDMSEEATEEDLRKAKLTANRVLIVGLMNEMEDSIHRFNIMMGIDESEETNAQCMDQFFGHGEKKSNSNSHPKVEEGSPGWDILARDNDLDMKLYEEIVEIFHNQRDVIMGYAGKVDEQ